MIPPCLKIIRTIKHYKQGYLKYITITAHRSDYAKKMAAESQKIENFNGKYLLIAQLFRLGPLGIFMTGRSARGR